MCSNFFPWLLSTYNCDCILSRTPKKAFWTSWASNSTMTMTQALLWGTETLAANDLIPKWLAEGSDGPQLLK